MTSHRLTADEFRNIFKAYKDNPDQQIAVEILRQHMAEDCASLLNHDSLWLKKYKTTPNPYLL